MPHRRTASPPVDGPGSEQPLWRGQLAPTEGQTASPPGRRTRWWGSSVGKVLVGFLVVGAVTAVVMVWIRATAPDPLSVGQLRGGDCVESASLRAGEPTVSDLRRISCAEPHDAEVFATFDPGTTDVGLEAAGRRCSDLLSSATGDLRAVTERGLEVRPLVAADPGDGEARVACFVRDRKGDKMTTTILDSTEPDTEDDR